MSKNKSKRVNFIDVDLYQKVFGPVSVKAIFAIYKREFSVSSFGMSTKTFSHCLNSLRELKGKQNLKNLKRIK